MGLVLSTVVEQPEGAFIGIGLVASGIPIYFFFVKSSMDKDQAVQRFRS